MTSIKGSASTVLGASPALDPAEMIQFFRIMMDSVPELADLPVIFISGHGRDETIARALESGAADYIVKPFSPTELTARVQAALRRHTEPDPFRLGDLAIYYEQRRITLAGHPVPLTATEYELLRVLSLNAGRVMTYDTLLRQIWTEREANGHGPVRAYVKRLRRKLGDDADRPGLSHATKSQAASRDLRRDVKRARSLCRRPAPPGPGNRPGSTPVSERHRRRTDQSQHRQGD